MASRRPANTFQLTCYATQSNEQIMYAVYASDSRRKQHLYTDLIFE